MILYKLPSRSSIVPTIVIVACLTSYAAASIVDIDASSHHSSSDLSETYNYNGKSKSKRSEYLVL